MSGIPRPPEIDVVKLKMARSFHDLCSLLLNLNVIDTDRRFGFNITQQIYPYIARHRPDTKNNHRR